MRNVPTSTVWVRSLSTVLVWSMVVGLAGCPNNLPVPAAPSFIFDGSADDGDASDGPPDSYRFPQKLVATDNQTQASSAPVNCTTLTGRAAAIPGPKASANSANAQSGNKVECKFTVPWNWWHKTTVSYDIATGITVAKISGDGTGKVFGMARITDASGQSVNATTYNYDIKPDPANPIRNAQFTGPGGVVSIPVPAVYASPPKSISGSVSLARGDYTLLFEMNVQASARDGVADIAASSGLTIQ